MNGELTTVFVRGRDVMCVTFLYQIKGGYGTVFTWVERMGGMDGWVGLIGATESEPG